MRPFGRAISPTMDQPLSPAELEAFRQKLVILGESALSAGNQRVVELVNFYWDRVNKQLAASRPLWRVAA